MVAFVEVRLQNNALDGTVRPGHSCKRSDARGKHRHRREPEGTTSGDADQGACRRGACRRDRPDCFPSERSEVPPQLIRADVMNTAYNYVDLTPNGGDEGSRGQFWVRRHNEYEDSG